ncbi:MAG: exonuclease SbcCD subunit D [Actinomycetota bacterium]
MKILHVADLHLGMVTHSRPDPTTGLPSRLLDVARCWRRACEIAAERSVDAVIVAGDIFHGPNPDAAALNLFAEGLRELAGIPALLIAGNHDRSPHPNRSSVLELFADGEGLVHVSTRPEVVEVGGLRVATLPSVSRHQLMAAREGTSRLAADEAVIESLERVIEDYRSREVDVLTGHWPVQGTVLGGEKDIAIIPEPMLPMASLVEGPWHLAAFGHIHSRQEQQLGERWFGYAGSIDRMNFGEEGEEKVAIEWELPTTGTRAAARHHILPAREFRTFDFAGDDAARLLADPAWCWDDEAEHIGGIEEAIVRIRISDVDVEVDQATIQRSAMEAGAHVALVQVERRRRSPSRNERVTEELGAGDALEEWFETAQILEAERPALRELAKQLEEAIGS